MGEGGTYSAPGRKCQLSEAPPPQEPELAFRGPPEGPNRINPLWKPCPRNSHPKGTVLACGEEHRPMYTSVESLCRNPTRERNSVC